jgi:hypothetical protein
LAGEEGVDFSRSFVVNPAPFNAVRFSIESITTYRDEVRGTTTRFFQCASMKSENTFGEKDLFYAENYDFMPVFGSDGDLLIFRRSATATSGYRELTRAALLWGEPRWILGEARAQRIATWDEIHRATREDFPLIGRTTLTSADSSRRVVLDYPIKTMNVNVERRMYQVDTGPLALPDLSRDFSRPVESLSLAFVAFNAPHFADFVVEQPVAVGPGVEVLHYAEPFSLTAQNEVFALWA